jgi:hypothetical protein
MPSRRKSIPPTAPDPNRATVTTLPTVTRAERKAQIILLRAAGEIAAVRTLLWVLHVRLGELPEDIDMGEGVIPDSVRFSVRGAIECAAIDHLDAAIRALEKAAGDTPESLAREWRERLAERKRLEGLPK